MKGLLAMIREILAKRQRRKECSQRFIDSAPKFAEDMERVRAKIRERRDRRRVAEEAASHVTNGSSMS